MEKNIKTRRIPMLYALINYRCPRCRVGKVYDSGAYNLFGKGILKSCSHCGLVYEKEPGYFYAAMYIGYAFTVAELVISGILVFLFSESDNPWLYIAVMIGSVLLLSPFNYRYSRMLLLYFLTPGLHYKPELSN